MAFPYYKRMSQSPFPGNQLFENHDGAFAKSIPAGFPVV